MSDILTVYYSFSQSTQSLAKEISLLTNSDILELIPKDEYAFNYNTAVKQVRSEVERGFCPELMSNINSIKKYGTIFIGSPNWFKSIAPPVLSFLRKHDFSDKIIVPFCTHGGGGFGQIEERIKEECPHSQVLEGIAVEGGISADMLSERLSNWLKGIGLFNGKS